MFSQSLEGSSRAERARVGNTHYGNKNHGVENRRECLDAGQFDGNDERRVTTFTTTSGVQNAVLRDDEADEEEIDDVEDTDTPDDLLRSFGDFFPGIFGLGSRKTGEFGSTKGK